MIIDIHSHPYDRNIHELRVTSGSFNRSVTQSRHPHIFLKEKAIEYYSNLSAERYIEEMDEASIDIAVLLGWDNYRTLKFKISDEYIYENWIKKNPVRLLAFSGVDPIEQGDRLNREALTDFEKAVNDYGFKGLKLLPCYGHYAPNDRRVYPFYLKALEFDVPVMLHMGATTITNAPLKYSTPNLLEDVALDFPDLVLVAAHMAYPWTWELFSLMKKHSNIYTDISGLCHLGLRLLTWYLSAAKEFGLMRRIMFGTDNSCRPPKSYKNWLKIELNNIATKFDWQTFDNVEINNLMGKTAMKLLKI